MPIFHPTTALRAFTRSTTPLNLHQRITFRTLTTSSPHNAKAGYGDMEGNPIAKDPQNQGPSNSVKEKGEHPGPQPPSEGKGTGAGPTKGGSSSLSSSSSSGSKSQPSTTPDSTSKSNYSTSTKKSPSDASAQSGGSRSKEAKETGSSPTGGKRVEEGGKDQQQKTESKSSKDTQNRGKGSPRIMDEVKPGVDTEEKREEVKQHNREFREGHDHVPSEQGDEVEKKFWEGQGGADRQP